MTRKVHKRTGKTLKVGTGSIGMTFRVDPNQRQLKKIIGKDMTKRLVNWKPALQGAGFVMSGGILETFNQQGAPLGKRWPVNDLYFWRKRYQEAKKADGKGSTPGVYKGKLKKQLEKRKPLSVTKKRVQAGVRGKRFPYVQYMQFNRGYWFVGWFADLETDVREVLDHHAEKIMRDTAKALRLAKGKA